MPTSDTECARHGTHVSGPGSDLYVFSGHSVHAAVGPVHPGLHWHVALSAAATVLLARHVSQPPPPVAFLYKRLSHCVQSVPSASSCPAQPALHVHLVLEASENAPGRQSKHVFSDVWPVEFEYFPAAQSTHAHTPSVEECVPSLHSTQSDSSKLPTTIVFMYLPLTQSLHFSTPVSFEYVPALHDMHCVSDVAPSIA